MTPRFPSRRPGVAAPFFRAHGLGNDYLVFDEGDDWTADPGAVGAVCHRQEGLGGDGIVVVLAGGGPPFRLRMFNPDGSEFERSGNGLRIAGAFLHAQGRVATRRPFAVEVGGDRVEMVVHGTGGGAFDVSVEMGRASTGPAAVELDEAALDEDGRLPLPDGPALRVRPVSVGNPHLVVFVDDQDPPLAFDRESLDRVGLPLATHGALANGANVQLARPAEPASTLEMLIWERGVGHTTASGTSSCAVAVAAVERGIAAPGDLTLEMEGGRLFVSVTDDLEVMLRGPVREVATGTLSPAFLESLRG